MPIQFGDVFIWKNFPEHHDGVVKDAWFLVIGKTAYGVEPPYNFLIRSTTQTQHYENGGSREKNLKVFIEPSKPELAFFTKKCVYDCSVALFPKSQNLNDLEAKGTLEKKGKLGNYILIDIYSKLKLNRFVSKLVLRDIQNEFNLNSLYIS